MRYTDMTASSSTEHKGTRTKTMAAATIIGIVTGLLCVALKHGIAYVSRFLTSQIGESSWLLLLLPVIGLALACLFTLRLLRTDMSSCTDRLVDFLKGGGTVMSAKYLYGPIIANILTLGFGGSAGAEGPIAVTGAAVGSRVGKVLGMDADTMRMLIGCGAGAGIAAIFKAPIGGLLFTLEILRLPYNTFSFMTLLLSCLSAAVVCFIFSGFTFDVYLQSTSHFEPSFYYAVLLFGVLSGIYSIFYTICVRSTGRMIGRIRSTVIRILIAGASLGAMLYVFPALYGEGYNVMDLMLNGDPGALAKDGPLTALSLIEPWNFIVIIAGMLAVKGVAVSFTTNVGVAGDFAPTIFTGSLAGLLFAVAANSIAGCSLPVGDFALIGMCAVFAGVIRAPFMAIFLTPEMTGNFTLFVPMAIASGISYGMMRLITDRNFYRERFLR